MSAVRALRTWVVLFVLASASIAWGQGGRGDLNEDGVVDAKDALRLLQIVEGRIAATDRDKMVGDVYPVRGTGERPFGDGQLTREDVVQMLRMLVGTIPRSEVTGEYEAPVIEDFKPHSGPVGTRVRILGQNFLSSGVGSGDLLVLFGSVPAVEVRAVSATEVEATVPAGVAEGEVVVLTPGGEARSGRRFVVSAQMSGRLELPGAFSGQPTRVVSLLGEGTLAADGTFAVPASQSRPTLLLAIPENRPNSVFLCFAVPGSVPTVNARTTAAALVLMQPLFAMTDPEAHAQLIQKVQALPAVEALAQVVEQLWATSPDPLQEARFSEALGTAIEGVLDALEASPVRVADVPETTPAPSRAKEPLVGSLFAGDNMFIRLRFTDPDSLLARVPGLGGDVDVRAEYGSPLDWFVRMARLDPAQLPDHLADLKPTNVFPRVEPQVSTIVPARPVTSLYTSITELLGPKAGAVAVVGGTLAEVFSGGDPLVNFLPKRIRLDPNVPHAVYVVRAYSGMLPFLDPQDYEAIKKLPIEDYVCALADNILIAVIQVISSYGGLGFLEAMGLDISLEQIVRFLIPKIRDQLLVLYAEIGGGLMAVAVISEKLLQIIVDIASAYWEFVRQAIAKANVPKYLQEVAGTFTKAHQSWKAAGKALLKGFTTALSGLPIAERLFGLVGMQIPGLNLPPLSPLETQYIIVGSPFGVPILGFSPKEGLPGSRVRIEGYFFSEKLEENEVLFGEKTAKVVGGSWPYADERLRGFLEVEVPPDIEPGDVEIRVRVKGTKTSVAEGTFHVIRAPYIAGFQPTAGYAARVEEGTTVYSGTRVVITGKRFTPLRDALYFAGPGGAWVSARIESDLSGADRLVARVPKGAETGPILLRTFEGQEVRSGTPFTVLGPPTLTGATPSEAKAGELLQFTGSAFPPTPEALVLHFGTPGGAIAVVPRLLPNGALEAAMPYLMAEGPVQVRLESPAGTSNAITVTRMAGRAAGAYLGEGNLQPSAEIAADGKISYAEALQWIQGKPCLNAINPFIPPFDDWDVEVRIAERWMYVWTQDDWKWVGIDYALQSVQAKDTQGHPGDEQANVIIEVFEVRGGNAFPAGSRTLTVSLDAPAVTNILGVCGPAQIPGIGRVEEGDTPGLKANMGKDAADTVVFDLNGPLAMDVVLDQPGSGGDTILFRIDPFGAGGGEYRLDGDLVVKTDDNHVEWREWGDLLTSRLRLRRLEVRGSRNRFYRFVCQNGLAVVGGVHNKFYEVGADGADVGFLLDEGATANVLHWVEVGNCGTGILVQGPNTCHNEVRATVGSNWLGAPAPCSVGLRLTNQTHHNEVEATIQQSVTAGLHVTGGAYENRLTGRLETDTGYGILLNNGAHHNTLQNFDVEAHAGAGLILTDDGTDGNMVQNCRFRSVKAPGIHILGSAEKPMAEQPFGNRIEDCEFTRVADPTQSPGLLIENLYSASRSEAISGGVEPAVEVWRCRVRSEGGQPVAPGAGVLLKNCQDVWMNETHVEGSEQGIQLAGSHTAGNTLARTEVKTCGTGLLLTDEASKNLIQDGQLSHCAEGVRLERGASGNQLLREEGAFVVDECATGLVICSGASNNRVRGISFWAKETDILIQDAFTNGNWIQRSFFQNLLIRNGPANTTIGGTDARDACYIESRGELLEKPLVWVLHDDPAVPAPRGVFLGRNWINGQKTGSARVSEGIRIEGASDVQIGTDEGSGTTSIQQCGTGIRLRGASNVRCLATLIADNGVGILVEDRCRDVAIGGLYPRQANSFAYKNGTCVRVAGGGHSNIRVLGNRFSSDSTVPESSRNGIGILLEGGVQGVEVRGNNIQYSLQDGLLIQGAGTDGHRVEENVIAMNKGHGVHVRDGARFNALRNNSIYSNATPDICLESGGNEEIPAPVITAFDSSTQRVQGTLSSGRARAPVAGSTVEVFAMAPMVGQERVAIAPVRPNGTWVGILERSLRGGVDLVATVTDPTGNTSAFGPPYLMAGVRPPILVFTTTRYGNPEIQRLRAGESVGTRLTSHLAADHSPALDPSGNWVAFVSERSGNPDIWILSPDTGWCYNLTEHAASDSDPAWSPDGSQIAFVSDRDGNAEIYLTQRWAHSPVRQLTFTENSVVNLHPTWSPDGKSIAFASGPKEGGNLEILVVSADGGTPVNITNHPAVDDQPAWSPDGSTIVFVSNRDGNAEIYAMNPDGTHPRRLTDHPAADVQPAWTPGGTLVFASDRNGDTEIYGMRADGGGVSPITMTLGISAQPNAARQ